METKTGLVSTTFRLTQEQLRRAKEQAAHEGATLSQKLRWFVTMWLARTETVQDETPSQAVADEVK